MPNSDTVPICAACGRDFERFGSIAPHRFVAEDLSAEICIECARKVAPQKVLLAEALERDLRDRELET